METSKRFYLAFGVVLLVLLSPAAGRRLAPEPPPSPPAPETTAPWIFPEATQPPAAQPDWRLVLVNSSHPMPENFSVELTQLEDGHALDSRACPDLQNMLDAARASGLSPMIRSSYRTQSVQEDLFANKIRRLREQGYSQEKAELEAARWVARPGTSEHQLGLAVDIVSESYQALNRTQETTPEQIWLRAHAYQYGFILRYPQDKEPITGIGYEPWHYRYVGRTAAEEITRRGLCLEEYLIAQPPATEPQA